MKFLMTIKSNEQHKSNAPLNPKLMQAIATLAQEEATAGRLLFTGGLPWSGKTTRIKAGAGKITAVDGPFTETKELIAGFAIFELPSHEVAVESAKNFFKLHQEILGPSWEGEMEVHPIFDADPSH